MQANRTISTPSLDRIPYLAGPRAAQQQQARVRARVQRDDLVLQLSDAEGPVGRLAVASDDRVQEPRGDVVESATGKEEGGRTA